jgi:hypothetical protein
MSSPLSPNSGLGQLLYPDLKKPGAEASVLNAAYPHNGHVDATLYRKYPDGRIYPIQKDHLDPVTYQPFKS